MKKTPMIILIPGLAIAVILGGALVYKLLISTPQTTSAPKEFPDSLSNSQTGNPSTFLGSLFGAGKPTTTPTPATSADLSRELKDTVDDGGQSDFTSLQNDANSL